MPSASLTPPSCSGFGVLPGDNANSSLQLVFWKRTRSKSDGDVQKRQWHDLFRSYFAPGVTKLCFSAEVLDTNPADQNS